MYYLSEILHLFYIPHDNMVSSMFYCVKAIPSPSCIITTTTTSALRFCILSTLMYYMSVCSGRGTRISSVVLSYWRIYKKSFPYLIWVSKDRMWCLQIVANLWYCTMQITWHWFTMLSKLKSNPRLVSSTESKWFWVYATKVCGLLYDPEI